MMGNWKTCQLGDLITFQRGHDLPKSKMNGGTYPVVGSNGIIGYHDEYTTENPSITVGRSGNVGKPFLYKGRSWSHNTSLYIREYKDVDPIFIYYFLQTLDLGNYAGGSAVPTLNRNHIHTLTVTVPVDKNEQRQIAAMLSVLDDKIEKNLEVNENLLQQAQALYREMFVNTPNESRKECRAEEYFDIAIGKTPPRKEHQWFTTNPTDVTWVSISDMGSCGTYISKSSEQLTQEAVDKFNIRVIPDNTVLLSFKLTVGRIAITHGEMTTNEAIAHFKTDKSYINEYLYCYLKDFNYQTMGSTSSIATAVNSRIIKAMPFIVPTDDEIARFHAVAGPMFAQILNNQLENDSLAAIRDTLLPKLMSGELDVSELEL